MMGRTAVLTALIALAGCAGVESAGRNAQRSPAPTSAAQADLPMPQPAAPAQAAAPAPAPLTTPPSYQAAPPPAAAAAPTVTASAQEEGDDGDTIVVPGQRETQVPAPGGDPRSTSQRMEDVRAWDQCVTAAQSAFESDPMSPQLDSPEEYCRNSLGMTERTAVPASRRERRR